MQGSKVLLAFLAIVGVVAAKNGRIAYPTPPVIEQNLCLNKDDGTLLPLTGSCTKYLICFNKKPMVKDCGAYYFNSKTSACDLPQRTACAYSSATAVPQPQQATTTYTPQIIPNRCSNKEDGTLLSVAGSCTKYIICFNGKPSEKDCGAYYFNALTSACDLPERTACSYSHTTTPYRPVTGTTPKPAYTEKEVIIPSPTLPTCYAVANGISLPVPNNARQYYFCWNNKAFIKDCGYNYFFDVRYSSCNRQTEPVVINPTLPLTELKVCVGKPDGVNLAAEGSPRHYHSCFNNKAYLRDCGLSMVFSSKLSACASQSDSVTEEDTQTKTYTDLANQLCKYKQYGARIAIPGSCSMYAVCTVNKGYVKSCGWRQFNTETASCDLPQNVRCQEQQKGEPSPSTSAPSTLIGTICKNQPDGVFVAHPRSCSGFFFCLKKVAYPKSCGYGLHFDPENKICISTRESRCVETSARKSQRTIMARDDAACATKASGTLLSSPGNCGNFLICDHGVSKEMPCPAGLHFNAQENVCDWPERAKCASN